MRREESPWWSGGFTKQWWKGLTDAERFNFLETLSEAELESFYRDWRIWGRDDQLRPRGDDNWTTWCCNCGRGWGKTRVGSEWVRDLVENQGVTRICLLGQGEDDVRDVMIEGESGLLAISPDAWRPKFYPSVGGGRLEWPNGALAYTFSAADPAALRGPQFQAAWVDEPMAFNPEARTKALSNLRFGLRLKRPGGKPPQQLFTTTPQPHRWIRDLVKRSKTDPRIRITTGSTHDNAENLAEEFLEDIIGEFEGTALGRQEIYGEILGDEDGALFTDTLMDKYRIRPTRQDGALITDPEELEMYLRAFARTCDKVVVAIDPNVSENGKTSHAAGIIVAGKRDGRRYLIKDCTTRGGPSKWGAAAMTAYEDFDADEIVGEVNQGGDLVKANLQVEADRRGMDFVFKKVRAWKGKARRAEPVASAVQAGKISHLGTVGHKKEPGPLYMLETQLAALHDGHDETGEDFDRADAYVYAMTRLAKKRDDDSDESAEGGIYTFGHFGVAA